MSRRVALPLVLGLVLAGAASAQPPMLQLTPNPTSPGCLVQVTLSGAPGSPFLIALDTGPGPVNVPGLGTVHLDLGPGFFPLVDGVSMGLTLSPQGSFSIGVQVPPVALLSPALLYLQAAVVEPTGVTLSNGVAVGFQPNPPLAFQNAGTLPAESLRAEDAIFVDIDQDGDLDLVVANSGSAAGLAFESKLLVNQGGLQLGVPGTFVDETLARLGGNGIPALCAAHADVDLDGDEDLFFGADDPNSLNLPNVLLLNQTGIQGGLAGHFMPDPSFPGGSFETQAAAFADVNGDGDLDLVLGNGVDLAMPQPNELLVNIGGTFHVDTAHFGGASWNTPGETDAVEPADLNGDGAIDLFFARDGTDMLVLNSGLGTFSPAAWSGATDNSYASIAADFDGDGDLDLYVANSGQPDLLYRNDGSGGFAATPLAAPPGAAVRMDAIAADFDGDGDQDVAVTTHALGGGERPFVYVNQGGAQGGAPGSFSTTSLAVAPSEVFPAVAAGDVDGDGDFDLFLGSQGFFGSTAQDTLLLNQLCP